MDIVAPPERATVTLPVELKWTVDRFDITGPDGSDARDRGYFGIFVDTSPIPPGQRLDYVARGDASCRRSDGCPDNSYLAQHGVHLARSTSLRLDAMPDNRPVDRPSAKDHHRVTIVLLNGKSERIGESAFKVEFDVDRGEA